MARIKNQNPRIGKGFVILPMMLLSVVLLVLLALILFQIQHMMKTTITVSLDSVYQDFSVSENSYQELVTSILRNRSASLPSEIEEIKNQFLDLNNFFENELGATSTGEPNFELRATITLRLQQIDRLLSLNQTLMAEDAVGLQLLSYQTCKNEINYTKSPKTILGALAPCKEKLQSALALTLDLPQESTARCSAKLTPMARLRDYISNHEQFVLIYQLSAKNKAKEAATAEQAYQKSLKELQTVPNWNDCLSDYLENEGEFLLK